jgi:hypothetical protein
MFNAVRSRAGLAAHHAFIPSSNVSQFVPVLYIGIYGAALCPMLAYG